MIPNHYTRFEITIGAETTEINPVGDIKLTKERADDDLFRFYLRSKLSTLTLIGADYEKIATVRDSDEPCEEITITITDVCGGGDNHSETFVFSIHDCEFNDDKCEVEVSTDPDDLYRCLTRNWEDEVNLLDFTTRISSKYRVLSATSNQFTWFNGIGNVVGPDEGGPNDSGFHYDIDIAFVPFFNYDTLNPNQGWDPARRVQVATTIGTYYLWIRFITTVDCIDGGLPSFYTETQSNGLQYDYTAVGCYNIIDSDCDESGTITIAWDIPYIGGVGTPQQAPSSFPSAASLGFVDTLVTEVVNDPEPPSSLSWFLTLDSIGSFDHYFWLDPTINASYRSDQSLYNSANLEEILERQVSVACSDITEVRSNFLQVNPTTVSEENYVTEAYNLYKGTNLLLTQITDIVSPSSNTSSQATRMNGSLKSVLELLNKAFRLFPTFNGDYLDIEHESQYVSLTSVVLDLSSKRGYKSYDYELSEVWSKMSYFWKFAESPEFKGLPMTYGPSCTNREKTDVKLDNYSSDVESIVGNDTFESDENGIVITQAYIEGDNYLYSEIGVITGSIKPNHGLAWSNLHARFHRHNRPLLSGNMNGEAVTHESSARIKRQKLEHSLCCGEEIVNGLVTTELGDGLIESADINLKTNRVELSLLYEQD